MTKIFLENLPWLPVIQPYEDYGLQKYVEWTPNPNQQFEIRKLQLQVPPRVDRSPAAGRPVGAARRRHSMRGLLPFLAHRLFRALDRALAGLHGRLRRHAPVAAIPCRCCCRPTRRRSEIMRVRRELGLDRPLPVQYGVFLGNVLRGDFGRSIHFREPACTVVRGYLAATLELGLTAFVLAAAGRAAHRAALGGEAQLARSTTPRWAWRSSASRRRRSSSASCSSWSSRSRPTSSRPPGRGDWRNLVLPALTLGAFAMASIARLTRSAVLEVLRRRLHPHRAGQGRGRGARGGQAHAQERRAPRS